MGEKCVRELMAPPDGIIGLDGTVRDLIRSLAAAGASPTAEYPVLLVTGRDGKGVALITPLDLFEVLQPPYAKGEWGIEFFWEGLLEQRCRNVANKPLAEVVKPPVTVKATATLGAAVHLFATRKTHVAGVTQNDRIVGIIRASDIFRVLADSLQSDGTEASGHAVA
ncbi:MAG: CBS domain-containing protein [Bacillota bacterium]